MEEAGDELLFCERSAGIDIGKQAVDWLRSWGVERAGMGCTSDYWKPVFFLLEQQGLDCVLYKAPKVKAQPWRPKTNKLDSVWLAKVAERGSVAGSFVPPEDIRQLRTHTRYRRRLPQARTAEAASGEAAGRRAPETVERDQQHPPQAS